MSASDAPVAGNVDPAEIRRFDRLAHSWWDPEGEAKPLHQLNPLRLEFVERRLFEQGEPAPAGHGHARLAGLRILDVGCGGGILAESMARRGAQVVGIDLAEAALEVGRMHALESGVEVEYLQCSAEALALEIERGERPYAPFDVVTCMELLEHVPDPAGLVATCAKLVRPGGAVFFSTINRNPKAYLLAVLAAEYLLQLLPRGTHDYARFIRPAELAAWARAAGLSTRELSGMSYNPLTQQFALTPSVEVNYLCYCRREAL